MEEKGLADALANTTALLEPAIGGLDAGGTLADCGERPNLHVQPRENSEEIDRDLVIRLVHPPKEDGRRPEIELLTAPARLVAKAGGEVELRELGLRLAWSAELPRMEGEEDGLRLEYWKSWDTDGETGAASKPQGLDDHHRQAKTEMEWLVERLSLPAALGEVLTGAIAVHDLGKDREAWQDGVGAPSQGRPYAKWGVCGPGVRRYRHEFGSLRDVLYEEPKCLDGLDADRRELALHLIASHHGRARPSIPADDEKEVFEDVLSSDALEAAIRYVRLQRCWGPWGLAWLESLFRSADATVSRRLEKQAASVVEEAAE